MEILRSADADGGAVVTPLPNSTTDLFAWSPTAPQLAFLTRQSLVGPYEDLYIAAADGSNLVKVTAAGFVNHFVWAPDGQHLAYIVRQEPPAPDFALYSVNADGSNPIKLSAGVPVYPFVWSPDGQRIAFTDFGDGTGYDIYVVDVDGNHLTKLTRLAVGSESTIAWSPDSSRIALSNGTLFVLDATSGAITNSQPAVGLPQWSPDGRWIAFFRDQQIFVMPLDGGDVRQITDGNVDAASGFNWSPDSAHITYVTYEERLEGPPRKPQPITYYWVVVAEVEGSGSMSLPEGTMAAKWSPNGQYLLARFDHGRLMLFPIDGRESIDLHASADATWAWAPDGRDIVYDFEQNIYTVHMPNLP
jgi:Tol biopolymer transport system component